MRIGVLAVLISLGTTSMLPAGQTRPFKFLHITDSHVTPAHHGEALRDLLRAAATDPSVAFVAHTGDVTELGTADEFAAYKSATEGTSTPIYAVPGNHDVRWAPTGKEAFSRSCGPLYRSVRYGGCRFIFLDSTVVLEHWGHFDGEELRWFRDELRRTPSNEPVFVFFHHWFGRERNNIDNGEDLLRLMESRNVVAMFVGHGHANLHWRVNGIDCFMARGLYQGSYHDVLVGLDAVEVYRVDTAQGGARKTRVAIIPLRQRQRLRFEAVVTPRKEPQNAYDVRLRLVQGRTVDTRGTYAVSVNGSPERTLSGALDGHWFRTLWEGEGSCPGWSILQFTATSSASETYTREVAVSPCAAGNASPIAWEYRTGSSIQGSPTVHDGKVYIGSLDKQLYALDGLTGRRLWTTRTAGPIFATPLVTSDLVIVGSTDHYLYAVNRRTGRIAWRYDAGSPVFSSAAEATGVVCVGSNQAIHGIDVATGRRLWHVAAGSFFQSRVLSAGGRFVLGGWDNTLYAVEARTGEVAWRVKMGRTNGGRGTLSFYYSPAIASPAYGEGKVYICTNDGVLHAVRLTDGTEVWTARAPAGRDTMGYSSPMYRDGRVFVGGLGERGQGDCYCFEASSGQLLWHCSTGADNYDSSPAWADPWVVIGSVSGRLTWISPSDGRAVAAFQPRPGYSFTTPAADDRHTYTAGMNGYLTAVLTPREIQDQEVSR